jgi:hypothetical protein
MPVCGCKLIVAPDTEISVLPAFVSRGHALYGHPVEVSIQHAKFVDAGESFRIVDDGHSLCPDLYPRTIAVSDLANGRRLWFNEGLLRRNPQICRNCFCIIPIHEASCQIGETSTAPQNTPTKVGG